MLKEAPVITTEELLAKAWQPATKAVEQGLARKPLTYDQEYQLASAIIKNARDLTQAMMDEGFIEMTD